MSQHILVRTPESDSCGHASLSCDFPRAAVPPSEIVSRIVRVFDADRLSEAFGPGQIRHRLLEPGAFDGRLLRVSSTRFSLEIVRYSLPVAIEGAWPQARVVLMFGLDVPEGTIARGHAFPSGALALFDGATPIDARLSANSQWAILTMDRDYFETVAVELGAAAVGGAAVMGVPLHVREPERRRLATLIRAVLDDSALTGHLLQMPGCSALLQRDIPVTYVRALAASERCQVKGLNALQRRNRLVKKAEGYVAAHLDESIRMSRLCKEIGASARSLEYAFQAVYGMGAMRYLRTIRLNEVRKALMQVDGSGAATVTSTAMEWGFWHLGEFAAAYKRLFGEVPSDTLRVAASRKPSSTGSSLRL